MRTGSSRERGGQGVVGRGREVNREPVRNRVVKNDIYRQGERRKVWSYANHTDLQRRLSSLSPHLEGSV